jgi:hypothetical protein
LASYADGILYDGIRWLTPQLRHEIYDALGLRVTVGTDGALAVDYHVDANVIKFSRAVEDYAWEEMDSPARIYCSRTETDTSIVVMKCKAETWRPRRGAASTKVATTPALIADGEAPAIRCRARSNLRDAGAYRGRDGDGPEGEVDDRSQYGDVLA